MIALNLPSMTHEVLYESVDVDVRFEQHRPKPVTIKWNRQNFRITQVNMVHAVKEGDKRVYYFSVSDRTHFFKLRFDTELLSWNLVEFYTE